MAKNYSIAEAVQVIAENGDNEALMDLGKRYPLLTQKIARVAVKAGEDFVDLMSFFPEYLSANKINSAIKKQLEAADDADVDDEDDDAEEEKPAKKAPAKKAKAGRPKKEEVDDEEDDEDAGDAAYDYDSMNNAKMYKLLGEMGKRKDCKEKYGDLSHDSMLKYLKKYGPQAGGSDAEDEDDVEESGDDYEGKSAVELYKLCKQRKIKAEQKKPAKYYIGLLKKADEAAAAEAEEAEAEDDEEWDDDEEEAPKKSAKKAPAKKAEKKAPAKKAAKKAEPEEEDDADDDDDDEWEI